MLKKTLLAFTVLGFAGSAAAADITNPFFLPKALHVTSDTIFGYNTARAKNDIVNARSYGKTLTEELQFGVLDNLAVIGSIKKDWTKIKRLDDVSRKEHNDLDWEAGLAWNILHCNTKLQLSSVYGQEDPGYNGTYKFFDTTVQFGYQFKTWLPYATFTVHTPVAQSKFDSEGDLENGNKWRYSGTVGVYQGKCGVWGLDTALTWDFDRTNDHSRVLTANAEASYYLTKNMALGVYGSYILDGKAKNRTDVYGKQVGARLRLYF